MDHIRLGGGIDEHWHKSDEALKGRETASWERERFDVGSPQDIRTDILETFDYWYKGSNALVRIVTDEFVSVCPWSGLPDFGQLTIEYVPDEKCIELKSLKYYLYSWRNVGMFYEHIINKLLEDLVEACSPRYMRIHGVFNIRGGLGTEAEISCGEPPKQSR